MKTYRKTDMPTVMRDKRGKRTQEEFAALLGITKQAVGQFENGKALPGDAVLDKLGLEKLYGDKK